MSKVMTKDLPTFYLCKEGCWNEECSRYKAINDPRTRSLMVIKGSKDYFVAYWYEQKLTVMGPRIFWKRTSYENLTFKNGRFYGKLSSFNNSIIDAFNLDWLKAKGVLFMIGSRKDLWASVIKGRITNPEDLYKFISRKYFKGAFSYASLKTYSSRPNINLWDLYYYTTNPELALKLYLSVDSPWNSAWCTLFQDMLQCAKILEQKINPLWSMARMQNEHTKQIAATAEKDDRFSSDKIAQPFAKDNLGLILDEKTCYFEGVAMHNCMHECYWNKITKGTYLIAKGVVDDVPIDLGISVTNTCGQIVFQLNQVHTKYNNPVSIGIELYCTDWIKSNQDALESRINEIIQNKTHVIPAHALAENYEDIPF